MDQILSQEEIDQLLRSVQDGEDEIEGEETDFSPPVAESVIDGGEQRLQPAGTPGRRRPRRVQSYDFKHADRLSRDHMRALERIFEQFTRTMIPLLSGRLRTEVDLKMSQVQQLTYGEFSHSIPSPAVIPILLAKPLDSSVVVHCTTDFTLLLHELLCGGEGKIRSSIVKDREPTDIELAVLNKQVWDLIGQSLATAWERIYEMEFEVQRVESNPLYLGLMMEQDIVVVATIEINIAGVMSYISICTPYTLLERLLPRLNNEFMYNREHRKPSFEEVQHMRTRLLRTQLPVEVFLGRTQIAVEELLTLKPGDVVTFENNVRESLEVWVGGQPKFRGAAGTVEGHLGVLVTEKVQVDGERGLGRGW